ncbi:hypothetical protein [Streptomyces griseoluteus]|uniref:hypothetical protein n=1 Tax=Streptomyces griseoluteus TaxID=29306 RepID=UPI0036F992B9
MDDCPSVRRRPAQELYGRLRAQSGDLAPARRLAERFLGGDHSCTGAGVVVPGFEAYVRFPYLRDPVPGRGASRGAPPGRRAPVAWDEFAELPDMGWPRDRAWCVGGDVDLVSTCVGGSEALIGELLADGELETHRVAPGDPVY